MAVVLFVVSKPTSPPATVHVQSVSKVNFLHFCLLILHNVAKTQARACLTFKLNTTTILHPLQVPAKAQLKALAKQKFYEILYYLGQFPSLRGNRVSDILVRNIELICKFHIFSDSCSVFPIGHCPVYSRNKISSFRNSWRFADC